jgi:hypothetical protein
MLLMKGRLLITIVAAFGAAPAFAKTVYVSTTGNNARDGLTWTTAKQTVQAGLNTAVSGDQVWVAAGTYVESIALTPGVALYGGFAGNETQLAQRNWATNKTILDGNQAGSVVTSPAGATNVTRIDGFTIRNGTGTLSGSYRYGGGIYCSSSSPAIANNTITGNKATAGNASSGGGIYCESSSPTITDNAILGNIAMVGGGIYCASSSPTIANNKITGNSGGGGGGGICCSGDESFPTIVNNMIMWNDSTTGGGIRCMSSSSPTIADNTIAANSATWGGGIRADSSSPTIINNAIVADVAYGGGGGICCVSASPTIANNTIANNTVIGGVAGIASGGIWCYSSPAVIANTILAFNSSGIYVAGSAIPTLLHNCVFGNGTQNYSGITDPTGTDGNISADPRLADPAYGNMHIQPDSPCVSAGHDAVLQPEWLDIDGQPRVIGSHVDIGADEADGTVWSAGVSVIVRVRPDGDDANDGSSWVQAKRTVQAGVDAAASLCGEVWVRAGTYHERITLPPFAHLYGGFAGTESTRTSRNWAANVTILDGQRAGTVVTIRAGQQESTIDGFTVRNGMATPAGGGIACSSSRTTVANNTIIGNTAVYGGGIVCDESSLTMVNNAISGNTASGSGGGVWCFGEHPKIAGNTITGNSAPEGGGIYTYVSSPTIANTIIAFNVSGIYCFSGTPVLRYNCVFSNAGYNYSGITDPTGRNGNISVDPRLVGAGNFRLQPGSPCIDAGDNANVPADTPDLDGDGNVTEPIPFDLAGNPRFLDDPLVSNTGLGTPPIVDMGAYEHGPTARADFDEDGDVDGDDLTALEACASGAGVPMSTECRAKDLDRDNDVDQSDFGLVQRCLSGSGVQAALDCAG